MKRIKKPWGEEIIWAESELYIGKILCIKSGHSLSLQYHNQKDETICILSGKMLFEYFKEGEESKQIELKEGEGWHITPGLRHRMSAPFGDVDLLEASTPELDDIVRLEDRYGRI